MQFFFCAQGRSKEMMCLRTTAPRAASMGEVHPLLDWVQLLIQRYPYFQMEIDITVLWCSVRP